MHMRWWIAAAAAVALAWPGGALAEGERGPLEAELSRRERALDAGDPDAIEQLARWCRAQGLPTEALTLEARARSVRLQSRLATLKDASAEALYRTAAWAEEEGYGPEVVDKLLRRALLADPEHARARVAVELRAERAAAEAERKQAEAERAAARAERAAAERMLRDLERERGRVEDLRRRLEDERRAVAEARREIDRERDHVERDSRALEAQRLALDVLLRAAHRPCEEHDEFDPECRRCCGEVR